MLPDEELKSLLLEIASESKANKMKVGALLINNGSYIARGFNTSPEGYPIEDESGETIREHCIHAEMSVIYDVEPNDLYGGTMLISHSPCKACALAMKYTGIKEIKYIQEHKGSTAYDLINNPLDLNITKF